MDALALLCTLHADGPSTLKNLRQAGCASLEALESMEEDRLSRLLGAPPAVARRFVREARHLRERLDPGMLQREETHADGATIPTGAELVDAGVEARILERLAEPFPTPAAGAVDDAEPARDPMSEVLEAWRDRDQESLEPPTEVPDEEEPPRKVRARPEFEFGAEVAAAMQAIASAVNSDPMQERPIGMAQSDGLVPRVSPLTDGLAGLFEGGDPELVRQLGAEGVRDLRELTDADVLAWSERLGFGYTRILRVVQLARRATAPAAIADAGSSELSATTPPAPTPRLSPAERPERTGPSILELEWNFELRPAPPPRRDAALAESQVPDPQRESAGGPFA